MRDLFVPSMRRPRRDLYTSLGRFGVDLQSNSLAVLDSGVHFARRRFKLSVDNFVTWDGVEQDFSVIGELALDQDNNTWSIRVPCDATSRLRNIMYNQTCTLENIYLRADSAKSGWRPWLKRSDIGSDVESIVLRNLSLTENALEDYCCCEGGWKVRCINPAGVAVEEHELRDWVQEGAFVLLNVRLHVHSVDDDPSYDIEVKSIRILDHCERIPYGSYRYPFYRW
ncbi:hypothetical protein VKT23_012596 [Stygiomarasmius scandens]|uniref:Uncharacterized protein n=1 Tax=Marasmiellus scandens TaxID=2682957 RepID=A0ABR1J884_9AGAR